jgi:hypothetical protein
MAMPKSLPHLKSGLGAVVAVGFGAEVALFVLDALAVEGLAVEGLATDELAAEQPS